MAIFFQKPTFEPYPLNVRARGFLENFTNRFSHPAIYFIENFAKMKLHSKNKRLCHLCNLIRLVMYSVQIDRIGGVSKKSNHRC